MENEEVARQKSKANRLQKLKFYKNTTTKNNKKDTSIFAKFMNLMKISIDELRVNPKIVEPTDEECVGLENHILPTLRFNHVQGTQKLQDFIVNRFFPQGEKR